MNKKMVWWKIELVLNKKGKKKKSFSFVLLATEKWADNILDALILMFEEKGFTVGGGMKRVFDE